MPLLNIFGELETFTTEHLYPYRYVITPLLIAGLLAAAYVAYRMGIHLWIWRHQLLSVAVAIPLLAVSYVGVDYFLSPLWERSTLIEASPLDTTTTAVASGQTSPTTEASEPTTTPEAAGATAAEDPSPTPAEAAAPGLGSTGFEAGVNYSGTFQGADDFHFGEGDALIIESEPGVYVLRFENFSVRNGPDLYVYLSEDATGESVDEALNLGNLKATDGAFNYEIPASIDVSSVRSAVVWCRQFSVKFAHAELAPAP